MRRGRCDPEIFVPCTDSNCKHATGLPRAQTSRSQGTPLTPAQFAQEMTRIASMCDKEDRHGKADDLMAKLLTSLGYGKGITVYIDMDKWYA